MPTRRQTMLGAANLLVAGTALGTTASGMNSTSPSADFRVLADPGLRLVPGRDDDAYVDTEEHDGEAHVTAITIDGSNSSARTTFAGIVDIVNDMASDVEELYFAFEVTDDEGDEEDIAGALSIVSGGATLDGTGDTDLLSLRDAPENDPAVLGSGEAIPFGLEIDLHADNPDTSLTALPDPSTFDVTLEITATGGD